MHFTSFEKHCNQRRGGDDPFDHPICMKKMYSRRCCRSLRHFPGAWRKKVEKVEKAVSARSCPLYRLYPLFRAGSSRETPTSPNCPTVLQPPRAVASPIPAPQSAHLRAPWHPLRCASDSASVAPQVLKSSISSKKIETPATKYRFRLHFHPYAITYFPTNQT